jgi:hypothetical protein
VKLGARLRSNWATLLVLVLLLTVAGLEAGNPASYLSELVSRVGEGTGPSARVHELSGVDQLQARFNSDRGHPRLVLLLSPT